MTDACISFDPGHSFVPQELSCPGCQFRDREKKTDTEGTRARRFDKVSGFLLTECGETAHLKPLFAPVLNGNPQTVFLVFSKFPHPDRGELPQVTENPIQMVGSCHSRSSQYLQVL
ncbi:hypothetical protein SAMN05421770_104319 [Granulicella rosea]|uniref:Uncharacterized protein n=1 Tax=Granulicella rosea TaxID=474952 RepID=A0A239K5R2_9BACT|nr:hypothetical protein SAMN05421770_104319 [Granulicella rosea]